MRQAEAETETMRTGRRDGRGGAGSSAHKTFSPHKSLSVSPDSTAQGDPRYPHACTKHERENGALRTGQTSQYHVLRRLA